MEMEESKEKIVITNEEGEEEELFVLNQTTLHGHNYLLVADGEEEEADAWIFKEVREETDDLVYEPVEDETEFEAICGVFKELIDDVEFLM
jgi:uncharacterized protein YrzB (UPF0473 family)